MQDPNRPTDQDAATPETAGGPTGAPAPGDTSDPVATLTAEVAGLKDRMLRGLADMENLRRRSEREVADAKTYGITSFAREMLTVADNLRRALDSMPAEARGRADTATKALIDGVELTERDLLAILGRFGVRKLEPHGQKFDPNLHQAMFEIPDESVPAGTVRQVVQAGYAIGERVLRPALVGVAKGGPRAAPAEARPAGADEHGQAAE